MEASWNKEILNSISLRSTVEIAWILQKPCDEEKKHGMLVINMNLHFQQKHATGLSTMLNDL